MIDWARVVGFDWDAGNERKSSDKHGVNQAEAEQTFFNRPLLVLEDERHSASEPRFHALGRSEAGRLLHVTFALRPDAALIRVISARDMSATERTAYDKTK
jgi:uncharacterized DUF497 family protein